MANLLHQLRNFPRTHNTGNLKSYLFNKGCLDEDLLKIFLTILIKAARHFFHVVSVYHALQGDSNLWIRPQSVTFLLKATGLKKVA